MVIIQFINPRTHYQPESFSSWADNGRGLIKRAMNKMPCNDMFITNSNALFIEFYLKEIIEVEAKTAE